MPGIDETLLFRPLSFAVLTVSDTRTLAEDSSGDILADGIVSAGHSLHARALLKDDKNEISKQIKELVKGQPL